VPMKGYRGQRELCLIKSLSKTEVLQGRTIRFSISLRIRSNKTGVCFFMQGVRGSKGVNCKEV